MDNLVDLLSKMFPSKSIQSSMLVYINILNRFSLIQNQKNEAHIKKQKHDQALTNKQLREEIAKKIRSINIAVSK